MSINNKFNINSPKFKLPSLENSHIMFKNNLFTRELLPLENYTITNNKKLNRIKVSCTNCDYYTKLTWPINTTNLRSHYLNKHKNLILEDNNSNNNIDNLSTNSSSNLDINSTTSNTFNSTIRKRPSFIFFDKIKYRELLLKFIINNNLLFSLLESPSFNSLLNYLKDNLPTISRRTIKKDLDLLYNIEFQEIKELLANNTSLFLIILDKQNSSNNINFLAVTIYYYNNNFKLQTFLLGFKTLEEEDRYIGTILYKFINNLLKEFNIRTKLLAITRDNASPINSLIQEI